MEKIDNGKITLNKKEAEMIANILIGNFERDPNLAIMLGNKILKLIKK